VTHSRRQHTVRKMQFGRSRKFVNSDMNVSRPALVAAQCLASSMLYIWLVQLLSAVKHTSGTVVLHTSSRRLSIP
jgi:ethanolamine utilization cobalamin adenosyltransferase